MLRPINLYLITCPLLGSVFSALSGSGQVNWLWVIAGGIVTSSAVALGFSLDRNVASEPADIPTGATSGAKPLRSISQSLLSGALAGAILYLLYQFFLLVQGWVLGEVLATVALPDRSTAGAVGVQVIFIQTQFLIAVLAMLLGILALGSNRRLLWGLVGAAGMLVFATVLSQIGTISLGRTEHLDMIKGASLADMAQGVLGTWGLLIGALALGGLLERLPKLAVFRRFYGTR